MEKSSEQKLIMITGCNKGVGFGILRHLAINNPNYRFLACVRSLMKGESCLNELKDQVPNIFERVSLKELDISKQKSIDEFVNWIKDHDMRIDCLVNNAAICIPSSKVEPKICEETFQTNLYGTIMLTEKLLPYLNDNGKLIFMTTEDANMTTLHNQDFEKRLSNEYLSRDDLFNIAKDFHDKIAMMSPSKQAHPFPKESYPVYCFSKLCLRVYSKLLSQNNDIKKRSIQVYACSPGWTKTEIGGPMAEQTIEEGAICPVNVINLPWKYDEKLQGKFFINSEPTELV